MNFLKTLFTTSILILSHSALAANWSGTQLHTNFGDALLPFTGESS
ncbi:nucleoside-binding protein, partial [Pseudoalteromonas sp. S326]